MERRQLSLALLSAPLAVPMLAGARASRQVREPIVALRCEGCEAVFDGTPASLPDRARLAPKAEPGNPLTLMGRVVDQSGHLKRGFILYAYQTNQAGIYPPSRAPVSEAARRHVRIRAWVQTNARGEYRFNTIRPGSYPGRELPEHIHMRVIEPGRATYYLDDVMFHDDPKLTALQVPQLVLGRGGRGIASAALEDGVWLVRRHIVLGLNAPGYSAYEAP